MKQKINPISILEILKEKKVRFFTPFEFQRIFQISATKTKYFLETYTKNGLFLRLKKGLYILRSCCPSEEEIACALYKPSYISFEYAAARYGIIPEMVYAVTSATTKPTREYFTCQKQFNYISIKRHSFTGYHLVREGVISYLIAEPEKAFVDLLYLASLGKRALVERLNTGNLNKNKVFQYSKLFKRKGLVKLAKSYDYKRKHK